ncbi:hypothetical protein, partial [Vibrio parahaemolyticus]
MEIVRKKVIKLDKKDYLRALLTDTSPSDTPLIFSNEGFYINSHRSRKNGLGNLDVLVKEVYKKFIDPSLDDSLSAPVK